jgi:hypothetical protein
MSLEAGFATLEEAVTFARSLAAASDWRFEILSQRSETLAFEVYDNKTHFSRRFRIRSDGNDVVRIARTFGTRDLRTVLVGRALLVGMLVFAGLGLDRLEESFQSHTGGTAAAGYAQAAVRMGQLALVLVAMLALLTLVATFRPTKRQARQLAKARINELTTAMAEAPNS